jgi:UDP-3-O-[3-hydroxymyristoyl] glucosamine N-acyltransferase
MAEDVQVGAGTILNPGVVLYPGTVVGEHCLIHANVVLGADGFGFVPPYQDLAHWTKIPHIGSVRIGNNVELGAGTCVDRAVVGITLIDDGCKIDNLCQIGHNVRIGRHTAIAGCVAIAGSARIGAHCTIGGKTGIVGHLTIADHVHISAMSLVSRSIAKPGLYTGVFPLDDNASWEKNAATLRQLHSLRDRIKALEKNHA